VVRRGPEDGEIPCTVETAFPNRSLRRVRDDGGPVFRDEISCCRRRRGEMFVSDGRDVRGDVRKRKKKKKEQKKRESRRGKHTPTRESDNNE